MPRNRIIFQSEGLFVGRSPSSGFCFLDDDDVENDGASPTSAAQYNLLFPIVRVQNVSYNLNIDRQDLLALGKRSTICEYPINPPTVNLNFSYLQNGVINELRQGLYCNYHTAGGAYYTNNTGVLCLSGFLSRETGHIDDNLPTAGRCRDKRNFFIAQSAEGTDLNKNSISWVDSNARNIKVIGFGDCYMNSYSARAAIGEFPTVNVSHICSNIQFYSSGSGAIIPALNPKDAKPISGKRFAIPNNFQENGIVSALRPGDISVSFTNLPSLTGINPVYGTGFGQPSYNSVRNVGTDINDIKIQSYEINIPLEREDLNSLGYKLPVDRILKWPIFANLSFTAAVGDLTSGGLIDAFVANDDYNVIIKCKNPVSATVGDAIRYDFIRSKFISADYDNAIGDTFKTITLNFKQEIDPESFHRGLFISGLLNVDTSAYQRPLYYG